MQELIIAILGAAGAIIALRAFDKYNLDKQQKRLEQKVGELEKKQAHLEGEQAQEDKETQQKVDEIEKEKNTKRSRESLVDWFQKRE